MSDSTDSPASPRTALLFAAALASVLGMAAGGGACTSSTLPQSTPGTAGASAGSGGTSTTGSAGAAGSSCAVTHRATPTACAPSVPSITQTCQSDADCTVDAGFTTTARCISVGGQMQCSNDACLFDDDCGARPATCLCQGQWFGFAHQSPGNACRSGNCRDDSDCPGTLCSPSVGFGATFYGYAGYYCHTPQDQCQCDADCASSQSCAYNPEIAAWACAAFGPAG